MHMFSFERHKLLFSQNLVTVSPGGSGLGFPLEAVGSLAFAMERADKRHNEFIASSHKLLSSSMLLIFQDLKNVYS